MSDLELVHPAPEALELYVLGAHEEVPVQALEAHLRRCPACTDEVRRQAQLDLALAEAASDAVFCPACGGVILEARCPQCGAVAAVGDFRIDKVLVQNAHGRMYLARDRAGQAVALKELAFVQPPHPDAVAAFEREGRLLRQLSHPQIPRFVASFRAGEGVHTRLYLAQEYVEGESLLARMSRHQFSEEEAQAVALEVLTVLEYLQSLSPLVTHRDIKPANLIRRPDGRIALVDFGAARDLGPTAGATLVGTFGYMPLEQMGGIVDATTDLYALGATLCHLLSRREPWSFLDDPGALARLNVSAGFRERLGTLVARRPADRYPSARAAAAAFRARTGKRRRLLPVWGERPRGFRSVAAVLATLGIVVGGALALVAGGLRAHRRQATPVAAPAPTTGAVVLSGTPHNPVLKPALPKEYVARGPADLQSMAERIEAAAVGAGVSREYAEGITRELQAALAPGETTYPAAIYYYIVREAALGFDRAHASKELLLAHRNGQLHRMRNLPVKTAVSSEAAGLPLP
jgi:Protein kinase domain